MVTFLPFSWERMINAVEEVRRRLLRATSTLEAAGIPYAVIGGNAVAAWVSRVDDGAVRHTQDVDLLMRRSDLESATKALESQGFVASEVMGVRMFLDGPAGKLSQAVHILIATEKFHPDYLTAAPDVDESEMMKDFRAVTLEALVRMKLTSCRLKDRVHLLDMIGVGLIDQSWPGRFLPELARRLQELLDNPNG